MVSSEDVHLTGGDQNWSAKSQEVMRGIAGSDAKAEWRGKDTVLASHLVCHLKLDPMPHQEFWSKKCLLMS